MDLIVVTINIINVNDVPMTYVQEKNDCQQKDLRPNLM